MWCYFNDKNNTIRYILGERGANPLFCIGINPSTAKPEDLDPTLKKVKSISLANNFDGWIMFNIYPQRCTNPNELDCTISNTISKQNLRYIKACLSSHDKPTVWAAWGTLIEKRNFFINCLQEIYNESKKVNAQWIRFGNVTKKGHPCHPLYIKTNSIKQEFNIEEYLDRFTL